MASTEPTSDVYPSSSLVTYKNSPAIESGPPHSNDSLPSQRFIAFQFGNKHIRKVRVFIFAAGICGLIIALVMCSSGVKYLLAPVDAKNLLGIDQSVYISGSLVTLATVFAGMSVFQIISFVKQPFKTRNLKRMDLSLIICSLICSLLFFIYGVSLLALTSSVDSSIARALDEHIVTAYGFSAEVTNVIDNLQLEHACCGGSNYEVYEHSRWTSHPSDIVPKEGLVPDSCCVRNESTLEIVDLKACHGDTLTVPNSANLNGCSPVLAAEDKYNLRVYASCSMVLFFWMALVTCCAYSVYGIRPRSVVV